MALVALVTLQAMTVRVTQEHIAGAERNTLDNPVVRALCHTTVTPWRIFGCICAVELAPPHRTIVLPPEVKSLLSDYLTTNNMSPFEFIAWMKQPL